MAVRVCGEGALGAGTGIGDGDRGACDDGSRRIADNAGDVAECGVLCDDWCGDGGDGEGDGEDLTAKVRNEGFQLA